MKAMLYHGHELLPYAKQRLQQGYYLSIAHRLNGDLEDEIEDIRDDVKNSGFALEELEEREELDEAYERAQTAKREFEETLSTNIQKLMSDVTIFRYTTTELTRHWIESMQPNFKVGLFFTKKKTEEEQEQRLEKLIAEANDKVKSQ